MALAIGVRLNDTLYVGDTPVRVLALHGYFQAILRVNDHRILVDDQKATEILPRVYVSCGLPSKRLLEKYSLSVQKAHQELEQRRMLLNSKQITLKEYDSFPAITLPEQLCPRLLIDAPREIPILRKKLYLKNVRHAAKV